MKKQYVKPTSEFVNVKLFGSVLGGIDATGGSKGITEADAKETDILWGDDSTSDDLWDDEDGGEL